MRRPYYTFLLLLFLTFSFSLMGCTDSTEEEAQETDKKSTETEARPDHPDQFRPATEVTGMLKEGAGPHAGDHYSQSAMESILDGIPKNADLNEVYRTLLFHLAEDYYSHVQALKQIDAIYQLKDEEPHVQGDKQPVSSLQPVHVEILLDASGSMAGNIEGQSKMTLAKQAVQEFASKLPDTVKVSLRVYGHKGSNQAKDKATSCATTETVYPLGHYEEDRFRSSLDQFQPTGWTPLAKALQEAKAHLTSQATGQTKNIIYVVSDGKETCGGDAVKAAKEIQQSSIQAIVNMIGFDIEPTEKKALEQIAQAGGGKYLPADTADDLQKQIRKEYRQLWLQWTRWGNANWLAIQHQYNEKHRHFLYHKNQLEKKRLREKNRLQDAVRYLKGRIGEDVHAQLRYQLDNRYQLIRTYNIELADEKRKEIRDTKEAIQKRIRETKQQMQDQYNPN